MEDQEDTVNPLTDFLHKAAKEAEAEKERREKDGDDQAATDFPG